MWWDKPEHLGIRRLITVTRSTKTSEHFPWDWAQGNWPLQLFLCPALKVQRSRAQEGGCEVMSEGVGVGEACGNRGLRNHQDDWEDNGWEKRMWEQMEIPVLDLSFGKTKHQEDNITASEKSAVLVSGWNFALGDQ